MTASGWACPRRWCQRWAFINLEWLVVRAESGGQYRCHSLSDVESRVILVTISPVELRMYPLDLVKTALYPASQSCPIEMRVLVSSFEYSTLLSTSWPMLTAPILSAHMVDPFAATPIGRGLIAVEEVNLERSGVMWLVAPVSYTSSIGEWLVKLNAWS